ncbi:MAG: DNA-binding protein [Thermodesulfobacteriota bacterium]
MVGKRYVVAALAVTLMVVGGCKEKQETAPVPAAQNEAAATAAAPATGVNPAAPAVAFPLKGKVAETLAGGGFSYLRLATASGEYWVAVPETGVKVGEEVSVADGQMMENFASKSLNRTFPKLLMSSGLTGKTPKDGGMHGGMAAAAPAADPGKGAAKGASSFDAAMQQEAPAGARQPAGPEVVPGSSKAVVPMAEVKVAKATGANAYTVAEVFAKAASLNGKKVRVQGKVMKVSANIMGRNWIHLQDGTGDPMKNTHDLVVTSAEQPAKGTVVTLEGVVAANKDFGAGYVYAVIVEEGKAQK